MTDTKEAYYSAAKANDMGPKNVPGECSSLSGPVWVCFLLLLWFKTLKVYEMAKSSQRH